MTARKNSLDNVNTAFKATSNTSKPEKIHIKHLQNYQYLHIDSHSVREFRQGQLAFSK